MNRKIALARLAAAINLLRPDWPLDSIHTILERDNPNRPIHDLAVAIVWVATDPDSRTPARVLENGPWWRATNVGPTQFERYATMTDAQILHDQQTGG